MSYLDEAFEEEREEEREELQELPDARLDQPAACFICGRPDCKYACFRCGQPVCFNPENYFSDSTCGGWILDTWHPGHPEENEFYCQICLHAGLIPDAGLVIAGIPIKADNGVIEITVGGEIHELSEEDAKNLIAYLWTSRGELFGKSYDPDAPAEDSPTQSNASELVVANSESVTIYQDGKFQNCPPLEAYQQSTLGGDDSLGDLDDHLF
jgi:hypothetical protein